MEPEVFYIHHQGEQRGPYTMKQVNHLYRASFIDDDTLYWREGMEQWNPVTEIVQKRRRKNRLMFWGVVLTVVVALGLLVWLFGEVTMSAWREMTSGDYTEESAWWRARGLVRSQFKHAGNVEFDPFSPDAVSLHEPQEATVELSGTFRGGGAPERRGWRVRLRYDPLKGDWMPAPENSR